MNSGHAEMDGLGEHYPELLTTLLEHGDELDGRGGRVRELGAFTLRIDHPERCLVGREGFSREFLDLEILMLLGGVYEGELVEQVAPRAAELTTPMTAYGPRVYSQLWNVEEELRKSPESRRAVVYVGKRDDYANATLLGHRTAGEMPCTVAWQFLLREGLLHMVVFMRSWDAVWGLSYDVPCFVAVQMALAKALGARLGVYHHLAGSFHVYERHWTVSAWVTEEELEVPWLADTVRETQEVAKRLLAARRELLLLEKGDGDGAVAQRAGA